MSKNIEKKKGFMSHFKPKCIRSMEDALRRLDSVTDETISLVKQNGHALERARPDREKLH